VAQSKIRHTAAQADYIRAFFEAYYPPYGRKDHDVAMFEGAVSHLGTMTFDAEAEDDVVPPTPKDALRRSPSRSVGGREAAGSVGGMPMGQSSTDLFAELDHVSAETATQGKPPP
jgi:hypothetical protein